MEQRNMFRKTKQVKNRERKQKKIDEPTHIVRFTMSDKVYNNLNSRKRSMYTLMKCSLCGEKMRIVRRHKTYDDRFGKVIITEVVCDACKGDKDE